MLVEGARYFVKEMKDACLQITKTYEKQGSQWFVDETTKVLPFSDVPSELEGRTRLNKEVDFTNELEYELGI